MDNQTPIKDGSLDSQAESQDTQSPHRQTEINWLRANLSEQAFRDWYWTEFEANLNWLDKFESQVLGEIARPEKK